MPRGLTKSFELHMKKPGTVRARLFNSGIIPISGTVYAKQNFLISPVSTVQKFLSSHDFRKTGFFNLSRFLPF